MGPFYQKVSSSMMSPVEYASVIAMISAIKHQLASLEAIVAAMANAQQAPTRTVRKSAPIEPSHDLSADEDVQVENEIEKFRQAELARMAEHAENYFTQAMDKVAKQDAE